MFCYIVKCFNELYSDLMKDYNENVYPANDQTQDINISVSMSALQLVDLLNEISGRFTLVNEFSCVTSSN
jgi:hypothetical protein